MNKKGLSGIMTLIILIVLIPTWVYVIAPILSTWGSVGASTPGAAPEEVFLYSNLNLLFFLLISIFVIYSASSQNQ